ncbi:MAG: nitroreductase [Terriglobia bacterium]
MSEPSVQPRDVSESNYPARAPIREQLRFLLNYAVLAPSSHNTQPWLFSIGDNDVELYADRTRALAVVDPDDRELIMSCGAALFNLRIALRHFGYTCIIESFPKRGHPDLLAQIRPGDKRVAAADEQLLFQAIPQRHTNRLPFEDRDVPELLLSELQAAAEAEGAWLHIVRGSDGRNEVADLIAQGDHLQASDKRFRRELAAWLHPNRTQSRDGIPGYAFGVGDWVSYVGPLMIRTFDWGKGQAAKDRQLATGSPVLAVVGTENDTPPDWLRAGQALERMVLRARAERVWASFMNQPIEVPELRPKLLNVMDRKGFPQLLVRMGYGPDVKGTPRRPVSEVLPS